MPSSAQTKTSYLIHAGLILCTLAVYAQVVHFGFVRYDDLSYVVENRYVRGGLSWDGVVWAMTTTHQSNWHPLTWLSLMLDAEMGGLGARAFHITSVILHVANTLLLFHVLVGMTRAMWRSAFVAALFAVHPLHVESVAWVAERKDVLSALFWFLAILAYRRYALRPGFLRGALTFFVFGLGLMAKPMLVSLPILLLVLDYWPVRRWGEVPFLRLFGEKIPLFLLSGISACVTLYAQSRGGSVGTLETFPLAVRLANAVVSCAAYIEKMFWPSRLAVPYPYDPESLSALKVCLSAAVLVGVTAVALRLARRCPYGIVGWIWYLVSLVPVIGLVQVGVQSMADRYTYLPLIGPFLVVAWGVPELLEARRDLPASTRRGVLALGAAIVLVALMARTSDQLAHWRDSSSLFTHTLAVTKRNSLAHTALGLELAGQGRTEEAIAHYREAVAISPGNSEARLNLAVALMETGRVDEAIERCGEAIAVKPGEAHACLGTAFMHRGDLERAAEHLGEAVRIEPDNSPARINLGLVLARLGRSDEALDELREALRYERNPAGVRLNLGTILMERGDLDAAAAEFVEVLRIDPDQLSAHKNLGAIRARQGRIDEAIAHFTEALRIDPRDEGVRKNLGRARALHPEGP